MIRWVPIISAGLATACPIAIGLQDEPPWIVALAFVGAFAGVVAGWRGISKPGDVRPDVEGGALPRYQRHD